MATFIPGASPPLVTIPIFNVKHHFHRSYSWKPYLNIIGIEEVLALKLIYVVVNAIGDLPIDKLGYNTRPTWIFW
jgi:hypothetical protein